MTWALASSGGKDSTLALDRALRQGHHIRWLLNFFDAATARVRFHGVRAALIAQQADRLGLDLVQSGTSPTNFEDVYLQALDRMVDLGAQGIIYGNIHLADVRAWYEERTTSRGLQHLEPLWGETPAAVVAEVIARGYRARLTSVDLRMGDRAWLGEELDAQLAARVSARANTDVAGERGEYHTFVFDGPLFRSPIDVVTGAVRETEGHVVIDLLDAGDRGGSMTGRIVAPSLHSRHSPIPARRPM